MLSFFRYRRTEASQAAMTFVLSSARDDTIAHLLIFEQSKGYVLPSDGIPVLEWGDRLLYILLLSVLIDCCCIIFIIG